MSVTTLKKIFNRDIQRVRDEINLYSDEKALWLVEKNIANSGGNLCLHLIGNLKTYIGREIGKVGYVRDRDAEFSSKNVPRSELIKRLDETLAIVDLSLEKLSPEDLAAEYPVVVESQGRTSTEYFLVHLAAHLSYHLGQINYHRRLLDRGSDLTRSTG